MIKSFWRYQIRYRLARLLIHVGLKVMPPGRARRELNAVLWTWGMQITASVAAARAIQK